MNNKNRTLLRIIQAILFVQALVPFYFWRDSAPEINGLWTRGNTLLCLFLSAIFLLHALLLFWVQKTSGRRRFQGFLYAKAASLLCWLLWLLAKIIKDGGLWIFLVIGVSFYLFFWLVADAALCVMLRMLDKNGSNTETPEETPDICSFCGTSAQGCAIMFSRAVETGKVICAACTQAYLLSLVSLPEPGAVDEQKGLFRRNDGTRCDFCVKSEEEMYIASGLSGASICLDCCKYCDASMKLYRIGKAVVDLRQEGIDLYQAGDVKGALKKLDEALVASPEYGDGYYTRGYIYQSQKDYEKALADYSQALSLKCYADAEILTKRGEAYFQLGKYSDALADFDQAVVLQPCSETYANRGVMYFFSGDMEKTQREFARAYQLNPQEPLAFCGLGALYFWLGRYEEGWAVFSEVMEKEPEDAMLYVLRGYYLARALKRNGEEINRNASFAMVLRDFDTALTMAPELKQHAWRGYVYYAVGDYSQALDELNQALEHEPERWSVYLYRALACLEKGQIEKAREDYLVLQGLSHQMYFQTEYAEDLSLLEEKLAALR